MSIALNYRSMLKQLGYSLRIDNASLSYAVFRLEHEGIAFLTKTLPQFSKSVLQSIENGTLNLSTSFRRVGKSCFSSFLRGWLSKIFLEDGSVMDNPCTESLKKIRQFCDYFYKLNLEPTKDVVSSAYNKARELERENALRSLQPEWLEYCSKIFLALFPTLSDVKLADVLTRFRPRYTSGAFFGSENSFIPYYEYKVQPSTVIGITDKNFEGISGFFKAYPSSPETKSLKSSNFRYKQKFTEPVRVSKTLIVPKDSRGPRLISKEPLHLLKLQMSFFDFMVSYLEKASSNRINFKSQEINRELARESSVTRKYSTLDLKDASDRVLIKAVRGIFGKSNLINWFIKNARSTHTLVDDELIRLSKVAGMGSGLTFPLLALITYVSVVASVRRRTGLSLGKIAPFIYVYGDDLIVPTIWKKFAVLGLESSGLQVNEDKSFSKSHFRESCGGDYFHGDSVAPIRLKLSNCDLGSSKTRKGKRIFNSYVYTDIGYLALDRHCRELVKHDMLPLAEYYYAQFDKLFGHRYGYTSNDSSTLGRYTEEPIYICDDYIHDRLVPTTVLYHSTRVCPYKYLSNSLDKNHNTDVFSLLSEITTARLSYGELAKPRSIRLRKKRVTSINLR